MRMSMPVELDLTTIAARPILVVIQVARDTHLPATGLLLRLALIMCLPFKLCRNRLLWLWPDWVVWDCLPQPAAAAHDAPLISLRFFQPPDSQEPGAFRQAGGSSKT